MFSFYISKQLFVTFAQNLRPMRKVFITLGLLLVAFAAKAQWTMQTYAEYDYTRTSGSSASLALIGDCQLSDNFTIGLGYQGTTMNRHAINLHYQVDLVKMKKSKLYLENRYLYRLFPNYNLQEFNAFLELGWRSRHFNIQLGLANRYTAPIPLSLNGGMETVFEPMNITLCIEGNVFEQTHPWNVGARISNYRDFVIERFTLFFYSLNGYYDFGNGLRLTAEAGLHPCGVLNLSSQYNGWYGNVGLIWKPKK